LKVQTITNAPLSTEAPKSALEQPTGCNLASEYDWNVSIAIAICKAESGGRSDALGYNTNDTSDGGLMQINSIHTDLISLQDRFDPIKNMAAAYQIYQGSGWRAWSAFLNGKYKEFI